MDLGTLFPVDGRSTRANAANFDGSIVVGWQDFNGPWKSAVWRKNPAGGYFPNEYILLDSLGSATDEYNQMGECSAVSANGEWIGGYGDYANLNQPWIWSRDSGVINLGSLPLTGNGYVSGMSADASVVVGWFDGQLFGDPQTPFIWTRDGGLQDLNYYVNTTLGYSTGTKQMYAAECISPDGNYIAGYGVDMMTFSYFSYRVKIGNGTTGIQNVVANSKMKVYPSPSSGIFTIEIAEKGIMTIRSIDGKLVLRNDIDQKQTVDLSMFESGLYSVTIESGNSVDVRKIVKN
jgi:Secretion system C-terminal sorting domain